MGINSFKHITKSIEDRIFKINNFRNFENLALDIFQFQYSKNSTYRQYVTLTGINPENVNTIEKIPFLPIGFFKTHEIITDNFLPEIVFLSSATTRTVKSRHLVADIDLYQKSLVNTFEYFFGDPHDYCFLALLPGYLERKGSSLIFMVNELMRISNRPENGFYLNEYEKILNLMDILENQNQKYILFGVTYALLDLAARSKTEIKSGIVMETGGMKGKRKEMPKPEIYELFKKGFKTTTIHSEYGMTELLTQAYSFNDNIFQTPPWMKILIRDTYDPFKYVENETTGGINVIDLANLYSCSFIETKDLGRMNKNGQFEVLGRFDDSDIRGCNLMVN